MSMKFTEEWLATQAAKSHGYTDYSKVGNGPAQALEQLQREISGGAAPTRQEAGRNARAAGKAFEAEIINQFPTLALDRIALLHKTGPDSEVTGVDPKTHKLQVTYIGPGPCDVVGFLNGGRGVGIELKSTLELNVWKVSESNFHQLKYLQSALAFDPDALVGYLIEWRSKGEVRWHKVNEDRYLRIDGVLLPDRQLRSILT